MVYIIIDVDVKVDKTIEVHKVDIEEDDVFQENNQMVKMVLEDVTITMLEVGIILLDDHFKDNVL